MWKRHELLATSLTAATKGFILAFQRGLCDSCKSELRYIHRTDEESTIYLVPRISCYQSSDK